MNEREIVCGVLGPALDDLKSDGFRLDVIYPADDPHTAVLSRGPERVRITTSPGAERPTGGLPPFRPEFVLTSGGGSGMGRAGMAYRDLIPARLGGRYIASHIAIPQGGPVSDWVHYHRIALQLIVVVRGWVRVVYEGQGDPFVLEAGDLVLQPPLIRHRVLESSAGLEVVEVTAPALHETFADHEMTLPDGLGDPSRCFSGQTFLRHDASETPWTPFLGARAKESGIAAATGGMAEVRTIAPTAGRSIDFPAHHGELVFGFILSGGARLDYRGDHSLGPADAFVIPPEEDWSLSDPTEDLLLLHITTARLD